MTSNMSSIWLPLLFLSSFLLLLMKKLQNPKWQKKQQPPGPYGLPIIGNLHQLGLLPHKSLHQLSKKYGPVMIIHLGHVPTLVVSSAEAVRELLKTHDLDCCSRPALTTTRKLSYNYIDVGFSAYGEYWKEMKKITTLNLFSLSRVQTFRCVREEEVAFLVQSIAETCTRREPINLSEKFMCLTADITFRIVFGKSFRERGLNSDKLQDMVYEAIAMLGSFTAADFLPYVGRIIDRITGIHQRLEKSFRDLDGLYEEVIEDHLKEEMVEKEDKDLIDVLLKIGENETEAGTLKFTHDHIKAILMNIFLGGVDTCAATMAWAMAELARNPSVMRKAQEEIRNQIGSTRKVCENDMDKFPYLRMVIKETLRLHPPGALLLRAATNQFNFLGYTIYPKSLVQVNVWGIGRDPAIWENPEEFYPERFKDSSIDFKGQNFELLPFGGGRRRCPGISMATAVLELTIANLLYHFDWKLPSGMKGEDLDMEEEGGITVHRKVPLKLIPVMFQQSCLGN